MRQFVFLNPASGMPVIRHTAQSEPFPAYSAAFTSIAQPPGAQNMYTSAEATAPTDGNPGTTSQSQIEQTLADIWCQVLGLCQVDIHQNFFYLGGDALRSLQVHSMALKQGIQFSLMSLYAHPTIYELACIIVSA